MKVLSVKVTASTRYKKRLKKAAAVLALSGLFLAVAGTLSVYVKTFPGVTLKRVSFGTAPYESPPRKVSGLLVLPEKPAAVPAPAVVFCHGVLLSKEAYLAQCRELSRQGLVVLAIDMRGHGATGGANDMGLSERRDVWAAADYLSRLPDVDPQRIAAAGHSLGGTAVTTAGIYQSGDRIKAVVAIGCQAGRKQAMLYTFGPAEDFMVKLWPFLTYSRRFDVNDPGDLARRDVISHMDENRPPNFLLIIGNRDSVQPVAEAEAVMSMATGLPRVIPGRTYGSFANGTARRLVVTDDSHLSEAYSLQVWTALARWLFTTFRLPSPGVARPGAALRYLGQLLIMLGFFLFGLAVLYLLRSARKEPGPWSDPAPYRPRGRGAAAGLAIAAAVLFTAVSVASLPFARIAGLRAFVPFFGADVLSSATLGCTILLLPAALILLLLIGAKRWGNIGMNRPSAATGVNLAWSVLLGVTPFVVFLALYAPTAHGLFLTRGTPTSGSAFFILASVLTFGLWAQQEYFHYFFLPAFGRMDSRLKRLSYILAESAVRGFALGIAFIPLVSNPLYLIGSSHGMSVPLVPAVMVAGFVIFLPISALALAARRRDYSVFATSLAISLFTALIFSCFLSVRAF
ncbi:MAG: alpha/beta fold hydrolase [Actinobacteria bacterium]|nr:alpha/beta fold hydrolase [Actinomycetota bacterium]